MDPKQLRTFLTIVELESFTRAGRKLGLSQSAISQHISGLERQSGAQLLTRSGSGAHPTRAGLLLSHYARQILDKLDEAQRALTELDLGGSILRIGAGSAFCHYLLPDLLKELHELHPKVELQIFSGNTPSTMERLRSGELDVGLLTLPLADPKLRIVAVGQDELRAVVAPEHPWAGLSRVPGGDFAGERFLIYGRGSQTFALVERFLLEHGVFPRIVAELDQLEAAVAAARVGLGVTIAPNWAISDESAAGRFASVRLGKSGLLRNCGVAYRDQPQASHSLKAFVRLCKERLPGALSQSDAQSSHKAARP